MARMRQLKIVKKVTIRGSSLDKYLNEISQIKLITADEEVLLAQRIKLGDAQALRELVQANLRFVVSVAKQYQFQGLDLPDLINEGNLGLVEAAQRFDETRGFKFISYAVWWIRQSILRALAEQDRIVRLPLNRVGQLNKINKTFAKLEQEFERSPTAIELAEALNLPVLEVEESLSHKERPLLLDAPINEEGSVSSYEVMPNPTSLSPLEPSIYSGLKFEIERLLKILPERDADIIRLYFGIDEAYPRTLEEIGQKLDLTRERVYQLKQRAIHKMKHTSRNKLLKAYLGR